MAALGGAVVHAVPITIGFEGDALGPQPNGFTSAGVPGVAFFDTVGADLFMLGAGGTGLRSLAVGTDQDGSALEIRFGFQVDMFSLAFGNDDPSNTNAGDLAVLMLFGGAAQIGQVAVELNRNDLMDQVIAFGAIGSGVLFDRVEFAFTNAAFSRFTGGGAVNVGASELVDDIFLNSVDDVVPLDEPSTLALVLSGLSGALLVFWTRQRRRGRM